MAQIILRDGKSGVVAGLGWSALTAENRDAAVRERARELDARSVIVMSQGSRYVMGAGDLDDVDGDDQPRPKQLHSLAALACCHVWAHSAEAGVENVVFTYKLQSADTSRELCAIVVIDAGLPVLDDVRQLQDVQSVAADFMSGGRGFANYRLLSNDIDAFPMADLVTDEELLQQVGKTTRLARPPVDMRKTLVAMTVIGAAVMGGGWYTQVYQPEKARKEALIKAQAQDPLPKYQSALAAEIGALGVQRQAMLGVVARLEQYPLWVSGWSLDSISCEQAQCLATWERRGGTLDALKAAIPGNELVGPGFDKAVMRFAVDMPPAGLGALADALDKDMALQRSTNVYQVWENAGIKVAVSGANYQVWPTGDFPANGLPPTATMKRQPAQS